jgi:hypothetical protein
MHWLDWFPHWWRRDRALVSGADLALSSNTYDSLIYLKHFHPVICMIEPNYYLTEVYVLHFDVVMCGREQALMAITMKHLDSLQLLSNRETP